jgi:hypothetical protein
MRHYLEPSIRAPKRFVSEPPTPEFENGTLSEQASWPECLLRIRKASNVYSLVGNKLGEDLARALWNDDDDDDDDDDDNADISKNNKHHKSRPASCQAVMEVEVELLTGRTHQIRGQLSSSGFPLVGDAQYGGAIPRTALDYYNSSERLALQCCELEFLDPDIASKTKWDGSKELSMHISKRWNRFRLEEAWWTNLLRQYDEQLRTLPPEEITTLDSDTSFSSTTIQKEEGSSKDKTEAVAVKPARPELLPQRVQLSPGRNKYVLIRATHSNDDKVQWFVKSAAPHECGGPYHGKY